MEPIISPWVIYAAHIMDSVRAVATIMAVGYTIVLPLVWIFEDMNGGNEEKFATFMLRQKWYLIVSVVLLVVIPTKEDILSMIALY